MTKVRQDAWSHEDDLMLAETVLRHIREGSTQLDAFEEVGDRLNRTGAACGFRWNAIVRRKYEQAIEIAKKQRKQKKRAEQRGRVVHPMTAAAFPVMETASLTDPSELTYTTQTAQPEQSGAVKASSAKQVLSMTDVIHYLQNVQKGGATSDRLDKENAHLKEENSKLQKRVQELEQEVKSLTTRQQAVEDDYQTLVGIMDRARRMVAFKDQADSSAPAFKMDENGNLEKIAK